MLIGCIRRKNNDELKDEIIPEIKRCNLAFVILMLKAFGVYDVMNFDCLDTPARNMRTLRVFILYRHGRLSKIFIIQETPSGISIVNESIRMPSGRQQALGGE